VTWWWWSNGKGKDAGRLPAIRFKIQTFAVSFILQQNKTHSKYLQFVKICGIRGQV
jgi:hypothetical protein